MELTNQRLVELLKEQKARKARNSFWEYRTLINPNLKLGWWQQEIANELEQFYHEHNKWSTP